MRSSILGLTGLALVTLATPAFAQDEAADDGLTVSGGAAVVTDYRFRGISQSDKDFAVQGTISVGHESGFYATIWGSSIADYVAGGSNQEIDFVVGWAKDFNGTKVDVGVTYYYYPGAEKFGELDTDVIEPYIAVSHTFGPVTGKVLAAYAPKQNSLAVGNGKEDNVYLALDLSAAIPNTPLTVTGHVGHSFGPSYFTIGKEYTDWNIGVSYTYKALTFGVAYVDTNKSTFSPSGENLSKGNFVGTISAAF